MQNVLFDECVEILKASALSKSESAKMDKLFTQLFPMTRWGKIDWSKINSKIEVGFDSLEIIPALRQLLGNFFNEMVYIEWDNADLVVIKTRLQDVVEYFDEVECVAFTKFIFNPDIAYIIEVLPDGKITVGVIQHLAQNKEICDK